MDRCLIFSTLSRNAVYSDSALHFFTSIALQILPPSASGRMIMQKTYAVTGVASGIGAELVHILRKQGHFVIGFDIADAHDTVDHYIPLDLNDSASIQKAVDAVDRPLDGLCNNAGLPPRDDWQARILQVNFLAQRAFTEALLDKFNQGASIVNMASRAGHGWRDGLDEVKRLAQITDQQGLAQFISDTNMTTTRAYNLSKEAMILWTMAEAEPMVGRGLRMNSLSPGGISTGILNDFRRAFGDQMARNVARAGRPGLPAEVAEIAAFLLSPASHWIKGTDIAIDGGMGAFNLTDQLGLSGLQMGAKDAK
jgi:NAD(P)-dependent dehydrogenase (short-subunit alcohol dehydrogenase family)